MEELQSPSKNLPFGVALDAMKNGKMVSREGWNGKGLFVFMQVPSTILKEVVPKMTSLPQAVKDEFEKRFNQASYPEYIAYSNQMAIVDQNNEIKGWAPSVSDSLATDWFIYQ